ncbi:MAG: type I polyketide synthase [Pseudonocardiaceae bacterium]
MAHEEELRRKLEQALDMVAMLRETFTERERAAREPIAVVGAGCRFPGGVEGIDDFWDMLAASTDAITRFPADRWDPEPYYDPDPGVPGKTYVLHGGFVDGVEEFDPVPFRVSRAEAVGMDPQQRLALETAWSALENAGIAPDSLQGARTGIFFGAGTSDYVRMRQQFAPIEDVDGYQVMGENSLIAGRLAYTLGVHGPALMIDTSCSSSLVAIHLACQSLRRAECDSALAGGVNVLLSPYSFVLVSKAQALSPDGRCKTFDAAADGYARGEGCGVIVLKRLSDARRDQDRVLAVIRGSAVNHDGRSSGIAVPNGTAQQDVLRAALRDAGVRGCDIDYVEAHGTGTALGDPIELHALDAVHGVARPAERPLWVGSVKTNIGHLEAAAGIAGVIKATLAVHHGWIPPHLHFHEPNPNIDWDRISVAVPTAGVDWPDTQGPRLAGVSSFGASGTNAHLIIASAPPVALTDGTDTDDGDTESGKLGLLALSARSTSGLRALAGRYRERLDENLPLNAVCRTAALGRSHHPHRLAVLGTSTAEVTAQLGEYLDTGRAARVITGKAAPRHRNRVAFLFSGQGAQYVNMGRGLYETQPEFRAALDDCAEALSGQLARPLREILFPTDGRETPLDQTEYTQPALFAVEYALARLWMSWGVRPAAVLGHSLGEYVAATVAGVLELTDALRLVVTRGRLMQGVDQPGRMLAVPLEEAAAREKVRAAGLALDVAAVNSEFDTVLSGAATEIATLREKLTGEGLRVRDLRVSHAFHSALLDPVLSRLSDVAGEITVRAPRIPLVSNLTGELVEENTLAAPDYWARHARHPVRFADGMRALETLGVTCFAEIGPGRTLLGLGSRTLRNERYRWIASLHRRAGEDEQIHRALGEFYLAGVQVDWTAVHRGGKGRVALPTYPFQRERFFFTTRASVRPAVSTEGERADEPAERSEILASVLRAGDDTERGELLLAYVLGSIEQALDLDPGEVTMDSDLVELGLDSLMAMSLIDRYRTDLRLSSLPARRFFEVSAEYWHELLLAQVRGDHAGHRVAATAGVAQ